MLYTIFILICNISFAKHIEGRFKEGKREEATKKIVDFYNGLSGKIKGFNGFIMSGSLEDPQKAVLEITSTIYFQHSTTSAKNNIFLI